MEVNTRIGEEMDKKSFIQNKGGFTLLEILIVMGLIGILLGIAIPYYRTAPTRAKEAVLKEDLFQLRKLINQYYSDKGKYPPSLQALVDAEYIKVIPIDPFTKSSESWVVVWETQTEDSLSLGLEPGIVDVSSGSDKTALDGTAYNTW
jgi:general secretion pathway protein G